MQTFNLALFLKLNNTQFNDFIKAPKQITSNQISKFQLFLYCFLLQCCVTILDLLNLEFFEYLEKKKSLEI